MKRNKGITLIALVITIIILIILAAITINAVFGENGLIVKANQAKQDTINKAADERAGLLAMDARVNREINPTAGFEASVTKAISDNGNQFEYLGLIESNTKAKIRDKETGREYTIEDKNYKIAYIGGGHPSTPTEDIDWLEVGAYVEYTPDTVSSPITIANNRTGYNGGVGNQTFNQDTNAMSASGNAKWRVVDKDETTVTLISETTLNGSDNIDDIYGGLWLYGAVGYNNAVTTGATEGILDEICRRLYSNSSLGITARSASGEDIDKISGVSEWSSGEWDTYLLGLGLDMQNRSSEDYRTNGNHGNGIFAPDTYIAGTDIAGNSSQSIGSGSSVNGTIIVRSDRNLRRCI